ncbi:heterokaryon incompatibility protein-domain-containing protein [Pyrenochaeta sp. MPI-SDFR-AT-0127]|nr:heterokaryon incompatibility protein-domain-containing protein [Pyrenochaeta sp. MPI-SDFR-AT-0127]
MDTLEISTTYVYEPLQGCRYIRLLEITTPETKSEAPPAPAYSLVQVELPSTHEHLEFEAISYTWGHHNRVSVLHIQNGAGNIALTANLTEALPHLTRHSKTKRVWIDQLCINQADNMEKAVQIGLMSDIYTKAKRVIVWLGPEDENSRLCRQWLEGIEKLIPTMKSANQIMIGSPEYDPDWRSVMLMDTFSSPGTDAIWAAAIGKFWSRTWFRRGWIVQEFMLAKEVLCLTGDVQFSLQDLVDLFTVPSDDRLAEATEYNQGYRILMQLKPDPFMDTPQPLRFLRLGDRLYGFLGMLEGLDFVPDYEKSLKDNFTRFAATIARDFGSLDFLSLWSANLDELMPDTPKQLLGLPSWTPSYTSTPLTAPWRLAVGAVRSWNKEIRWNAAAGRRHIYDQPFDAVATGQLQVRGRIIDRIDHLSSARIARFQDVDEKYLTSIITQINKDLSGFEDWTQIQLINFLNTVSSNGVPPREPAEQLLGLVPGILGEHTHLSKHENSLTACLHMGRGRKFMKTETGRKGLAPYIGSVASEGKSKGSAIVVLHGCIVPIVLQCVGEEGDDGGHWKVIGDCYVEGIMFGEAVKWAESDVRTFILV